MARMAEASLHGEASAISVVQELLMHAVDRRRESLIGCKRSFHENHMGAKQKSVDEYSERETERRFKGALSRMLHTPHKPQAPIGEKHAGLKKRRRPQENTGEKA